MASIKISALGELELDRLSDADVFIVNDQDATTQKITFETLKLGLDRDSHAFRGRVEFHDEVAFLGPVSGRDVYTKTETLEEIDSALQPVKDDVAALEEQQGKIIDNIGTDASTYITGELQGSMLGAGPKTIKQALSSLGLAHDAHTVLINQVQGKVDDNAAAIAAEAAINVTQDGRLDVLEAAVGLPGNGIDDNTSLIEDNKDLIDKLYQLQGVSEGTLVFTFAGSADGGLGGDYNALEALTSLNTGLVANKVNIEALQTEALAAGTKVQENRNRINALQQGLADATNGFTGTAEELATAIFSFLNGLSPLA